MAREVEVISPDAMVADAALRMAKLDAGAMPVCEGERLVGILTDRDPGRSSLNSWSRAKNDAYQGSHDGHDALLL
jgi:CBS domain-containing protein